MSTSRAIEGTVSNNAVVDPIVQPHIDDGINDVFADAFHTQHRAMSSIHERHDRHTEDEGVDEGQVRTPLPRRSGKRKPQENNQEPDSGGQRNVEKTFHSGFHYAKHVHATTEGSQQQTTREVKKTCHKRRKMTDYTTIEHHGRYFEPQRNSSYLSSDDYISTEKGNRWEGNVAKTAQERYNGQQKKSS